jgi:hypothetical protein
MVQLVDELSPVIIPTLHRIFSLKRCIASLQRCYLAERTVLYIAIDFPPSEEYLEGWREVSKYCETIAGFKEVVIVRRETNFGARDNVNSVRQEVFKRYDSFIMTEDDNQFSRDFLYFMNSALRSYSHRGDVFGICGYAYPFARSLKEKYFLYRGFSAWGWGGWRDKWASVDWSIDFLKSVMEDSDLRRMVSNSSVRRHLDQILASGHVTSDSMICLHLYLNRMSCLFPAQSRVRNHGHDGSGVNCGSNPYDAFIYGRQELYAGSPDYVISPKLVLDRHLGKQVDVRLSRYGFFNIKRVLLNKIFRVLDMLHTCFHRM